MTITNNDFFPFGDLPFEIRMKILKYAKYTKLDVLKMIQTPYNDEYNINIKNNNVSNFLDVIKNTHIRVIIFTGKHYNNAHKVIQSKMEKMTLEKLGVLRLICSSDIDEHVYSKLYMQKISLHNMAQYKNVLKLVDDSKKHVTLYRKKLLLISVGYPTKKKDTPTYKAYNDMIEKLKEQYIVKVVYLNSI